MAPWMQKEREGNRIKWLQNTCTCGCGALPPKRSPPARDLGAASAQPPWSPPYFDDAPPPWPRPSSPPAPSLLRQRTLLRRPWPPCSAYARCSAARGLPARHRGLLGIWVLPLRETPIGRRTKECSLSGEGDQETRSRTEADREKMWSDGPTGAVW